MNLCQSNFTKFHNKKLNSGFIKEHKPRTKYHLVRYACYSRKLYGNLSPSSFRTSRYNQWYH